MMLPIMMMRISVNAKKNVFGILVFLLYYLFFVCLFDGAAADDGDNNSCQC